MTPSPTAPPTASPLPTYVAEGADTDRSEDGGSDSGPGTGATAVLLLRLGVADADYRCHGQVHVLAGLLAEAVGERPVETHVVVGPVTTRLEVSGAVPEVGEALEALAAWVHEPDWSGLPGAVQRVLTEDPGEVDDVLAVASLSRWGRRGAGLLGLDPVGLHALTVEDLDAWRTSYLTSANVHLVTDHAGLAERGLTLLDGPAVPVRHQPGLPLPLPGRTSWTGRDGGVPAPGDTETTPGVLALTALTHDPATTRVLAALLRSRLAAGAGTRPRTRTRALPVGDRLLWVHEHTGVGPATVYDVVRSLSRGELEERELVVCVDRLGRNLSPAPLARAERDGLGDLLGLPTIRAVDDVSLDDVVAEAREVVPSLLILGDDAATGSASGPVQPSGTADLRLIQKPLLRAPGEVRSRHRSRSRGGGVLVVGEHTCEVTRTLTRDGVAWDDLVAVHHLSPAERLLVPHRGATLLVDAATWRHGTEAVAGIDAAVPAGLVVREPAPVSAEPEATEPPPGPDTADADTRTVETVAVEPEPEPEAEPEPEPEPATVPGDPGTDDPDEATRRLRPVVTDAAPAAPEGVAAAEVATVAPVGASGPPEAQRTRQTPAQDPGRGDPARDQVPRAPRRHGGSALDAFPGAFIDDDESDTRATSDGTGGPGAVVVLGLVVVLALLATLFYGSRLLYG